MGIDYASAKKLVQLAAKTDQQGRVPMLGRAKLRMPPRLQKALERVLASEGFDYSYAETFWRRLGYSDVLSMDFSDYESAEILHDLTDPVPQQLQGQFDLVFDGGTTEHVFDVATCMTNLFHLLVRKGVFVGCSPANGWLGHGFYKFGPELVYGFWKLRMGCEILYCSMLPELPRHKEVPLQDNIQNGNRIKLYKDVPPGRVYLYYEAQKGETAGDRSWALQSDYVAKWNRFDAAEGREETDVMKLRKEHMET